MKQMKQKLVITINRQYGSMGGKVSAKVADKLGIKVFDDEIIDRASAKSGIKKDYFYQAERFAGIGSNESLIYSLVNRINEIENQEMMPNKELLQKIYSVQSTVIEELAEEQSCIIIDHVGCHVLSRHPKCVKVFTCAELSYRVSMAKKMLHLSDEQALAHIREIDGERKSYFEKYARHQWDNPESYDMSLNIRSMGIDAAADAIYAYANQLS
ncbi:cytidylate kinase-like family protein [Hespellia stercorisuis]|uniref:Cytidylate kinase-like family protein n=1 Tax=Hespellia stercorisuis DSM 15480 TaxID=1121950 RepID=A0A1M6QIC1_9FIRM|nr:cytidylate kinase-like family protein [Hespellia stercorisuis]SHK19803.1 Cytidylate kinase-like family protein [Hespellia stercorisuis DSM 15480]